MCFVANINIIVTYKRKKPPDLPGGFLFINYFS